MTHRLEKVTWEVKLVDVKRLQSLNSAKFKQASYTKCVLIKEGVFDLVLLLKIVDKHSLVNI